MSKFASRRGVLVLAALAAVALMGGCPWTTIPDGDGSNTKAALKRFNSTDELVTFFRQRALARHTRGFGLFGAGDALPTADMAADGQENGGGDDSDDTSYSTTNIQEEGVDESDKFKSNGAQFFIAKGPTLRIIDAVPFTDMAELASVDFGGYMLDSLYLVGTKVLVLGQTWGLGDPRGGPEIMIWPPYYQNATTLVAEVDVSDPANPVITQQNELDGSLVTSRLTNGRLIVVLTIAPPVPENLNVFTAGAIGVDDVLPRMRARNGSESVMVPAENWYHPETPDGYYSTAVLTFDAADVTAPLGTVAVLANAGTIYASTEALYITDTEYTEDNNYRSTTALHKLAFNDEGIAEYVASGSVPGRLLNQFSLGEYEGYLRVATHIDPDWLWGAEGVDVAVAVADTGAREQDADDATDADPDTDGPRANSENNAVYVLDEVDGVLEIVGAVEDIAPTEQLYAARFLGTRGFLVTFLRIDPLFVLDLTEPTNPQLLGELEIPGYSDYLHPFGDDLLIGVGRSTRESPWGGVVPDAVQLSLFDVSDLANPTLLHQLELGGYGSTCDASWTHKAFTFMPDRALLAIPLQLMPEQSDPYNDWEYYYGPVFDGVACFTVDAENGFTELGRVESVVYDNWYYWSEWRRAAVIDDVLYAVTPAGVRAASMDDFENPDDLVLTPNDGEIGGDEPVYDGDDGEAEPGNPGEGPRAA